MTRLIKGFPRLASKTSSDGIGKLLIANKNLLLGILIVFVYLSFVCINLPNTGLVWDETHYISGAKARVYSVYSAFTGAPSLEACSMEVDPSEVTQEQLSTVYAKCWYGRSRLSQTLSGFTWAAAWAINGGHLEFMASILAHRIVTVALAALCVFFVFLFAAEAFGTRAGIFSALSIIFIPRFFTHSMYMTLDAAVACLILVAVYIFWKGLKSWKWGVFAGVAMGLAVSAKVNAYFVPPVLLLWFMIGYRDRIAPILRSMVKRKFSLKSVPIAIYSFIFISPLVYVLSYPWLWKDPVNRYLYLMFRNIYHEKFIHVNAFYMGVTTGSAPWHYIWVITAITLPVSILVLSIIGSFRSFRDCFTLRNRDTILVLMGVLVPFLLFTSPYGSPHGGVRIFLNIFPFIALLSGLGADMIVGFSRKYTKRTTLVSGIIIVLIVVPAVFTMTGGNMPSAAVYYNELIGGPSGAYAGGFEMDHYGESYIDIAKWLNVNAKEGAVLYVPIATNIFNMYKYGDIGIIGQRFLAEEHGLGETEAVPSLGLGSFEQRGFLRQDMNISDKEEGSDYFVILNIRSVVDSGREAGHYNSTHYHMYMDKCEPLYSAKSGTVPVSMVYETGCYLTGS